jgi:uncharacterized protein
MAKKTIKKSTPKKSVKRKSVKRNDFIVTKKQIKLAPIKVEKETAYPIMNADGELMVGILHSPTCKTDTLIIAVHGFIGDKERTLIKQSCIDISRAGYAAYRFDLSGNGDSEGRFEDALPKKSLRDIQVVIHHFRKQYAKIILLGHSLGGTFSIITAAHTKVEGVIAIAAPMHMDQFAGNLRPEQQEQLRSVGFTMYEKKTSVGLVYFTVTAQYVAERSLLQPLVAAADVHCPVLVAHGTLDPSVPMSDSEELVGNLFKKDLLILGGADHLFSNPQHLDALIAGVIEWLEKICVVRHK